MCKGWTESRKLVGDGYIIGMWELRAPAARKEGHWCYCGVGVRELQSSRLNVGLLTVIIIFVVVVGEIVVVLLLHFFVVFVFKKFCLFLPLTVIVPGKD